MTQSGVDSNARILVVDDNLENAVLLEALLGHAGYVDVKSLIDPSKVMETVLGWNPDLVVLDLHMPGLTGYDILGMFNDQLPQDAFVPVLISTADGTMAARKRAFDLGACDFITKPYDATEMLLRVRNFLRMRQMHLQLQERNGRLSEANDALRRSEAELKAANTELEGFTSSVSHDLRGPLRAILSTSRMLMEDLSEKLDKEHLRMLERQDFNASRLSTLIDELLKLSRVSRADMVFRELDLSQLASEVVEEIRPDAPPGLEFTIAEGLKAVGDPILIRLLLVNLMGNAAKFSPRGGRVVIGQASIDGNPFFVKDEGVGFDPTHADKLFKPFERLVSEAEFPGNGVGLANVKRIVNRHGGKVWAESQPGQGACFYFTLS